MVLNDKSIRKLVNEKELISPFEEKKLQSESYDLTLGNRISVLNKIPRFIDLRTETDCEKLYKTLELTEEGYPLSPNEYVLVMLKERINLPENITAHIRPRTRFTRLGLIVSNQHCNSTYSGVLHVGIFNATNSTINIVPDIKICQIVFEELNDIPSENKQYKNKDNALYQNESNDEFRGPKLDEKTEKIVKNIVDSYLGD